MERAIYVEPVFVAFNPLSKNPSNSSVRAALLGLSRRPINLHQCNVAKSSQSQTAEYSLSRRPSQNAISFPYFLI